MKILITGGTGLVGKSLKKELLKSGHELILMTRNPQQFSQEEKVTYYKWDSINDTFPRDALDGVESIINLMGENLADKRWSDKQKEKLKNSRIIGTNKIVQALNNSDHKLKCFVSASAIGIYPVNNEVTIDEFTKNGEGFLANLCHDWEASASQLKTSTRKITIRIGVVLARSGGALGKLIPLFKMGLGGPIGNGQQYMSWIHVSDLVSLISKAIDDESFNGVYNGTTPKPVTNLEFTKALAKAVQRPAFLPAPPFMLKLAMGEMSSIILDSQKVISKRLEENHFKFNFPDIDSALKDIITN
ncbi:MAG: TIGR01777 family protein [Bdellovibrio sp. CG12_big_fil_rev_8_21_14_0_65_39_13]|nr:MAG: TIGR01777 family protein [Bdellovibrio sp. CG22_combo_CG10-13_8_21_14_all_39_27]PIQ58866.1 MAG: TIGR01777 family protein [Bdellovibrio sp. CG12_big_fil_rev_8_21_14_0_65_39_13]PIR35957.1 MAG: TIGR01777 family protein [Bdellovibrio sp. CG11_big_fil_rev_8_21_14_0_20_39_38]